jgi:signal transduction histidine kinase
LSKLNSLAPGAASVSAVPESLEERVQRLNIAIDEVRRQLEDLSPEPGN